MAARGRSPRGLCGLALSTVLAACASSSGNDGNDDGQGAAGSAGASASAGTTGTAAGSAGTSASAGTAGTASGSGGAIAGGAGATAGTAGSTAGGGGFAAGGTPNTSGAAGTSGSAGASGTAAVSPVCEASPVPLESAVLLVFPVELAAGSSPFNAGEEHTTEQGNRYRASIVSFFLSRASLITSSGERVPAQFATPEGSPRPYDLHLVNSMDPSSFSLELLVRPGSYSSLELGVGVPPECNHIDPTTAVYPLNASTGLYWTWATGYMFIRAEGQFQNDSDWSSFVYHVGFDEAYRTVSLDGALSAPASAATPKLVLDVSRLLEGDAEGGLHVVPDFEFADQFAAPGTLSLRP